MSATKTGNLAHDSAMAAADGTRQVSLAAATTQSAARTADITFARAGVTSCKANGINPAQFITQLFELGTGGV
jgi:hypothetical protein